MICTAIGDYERYLAFVGILLTTVAALALLVRASSLFELPVRSGAYWTFSALRDVARKHAKIDANTTISPLLEGSEVVTEHANARRRGGFGGMRPAVILALKGHNKVRADLRLPFQAVEWPTGFVRSELVERSWREVQAAIPRHIEVTPISQSRWAKCSIVILLAGSALQLLAALPLC